MFYITIRGDIMISKIQRLSKSRKAWLRKQGRLCLKKQGKGTTLQKKAGRANVYHDRYHPAFISDAELPYLVN